MVFSTTFDIVIVFFISLGIIKYLLPQEKEYLSFKWFLLSGLFLILNTIFIIIITNPNFIFFGINLENFDFILPLISLIVLIIGIFKFIWNF